ncbi:MAG: hypothetical protein H6978_10675 [Gammaproteobacteria bacterium]|nr:hypothetical protein [Gammaproteobacteria bacterium]
MISGRTMARAVMAAALTLPAALSAQQSERIDDWWSPGQGTPLPERANYSNAGGMLGVFNQAGVLETKGHAFFEPLGSNGRACVSCHQPSDGMSISVATVQRRWQATAGRDPIFAEVDGANCPNQPRGEASSHSLLLERGLFRIGLPWPPRDANGAVIEPEYDLELVSDPVHCNSDSEYGITSATPTVSVYRRPRPVANFKYFAYPRGPGLGFNIKDGTPLDRDPETGYPSTMNIMADAREPTLKQQAINAGLGHLQTQGRLSEAQLKQITDFEAQVYVAQAYNEFAGSFETPSAPDSLGPVAVANGVPGLGDNLHNPVFGFYESWKREDFDGSADGADEFKASVARGSDVFFLRQFWLKDTTHINSIGLGNPLKRTCATCHNARMTGMDLAPGWVDLGTTNYPTWNGPRTFTEDSPLPVFKLTCKPGYKTHPYLGTVVYTHDPGRALISGRCVDIGAITMQQMRGLAARAPYFANGSAKSIAEIVDYYDRRFNIGYSEQERQDLINFLSVL